MLGAFGPTTHAASGIWKNPLKERKNEDGGGWGCFYMTFRVTGRNVEAVNVVIKRQTRRVGYRFAGRRYGWWWVDEEHVHGKGHHFQAAPSGQGVWAVIVTYQQCREKVSSDVKHVCGLLYIHICVAIFVKNIAKPMFVILEYNIKS